MDKKDLILQSEAIRLACLVTVVHICDPLGLTQQACLSYLSSRGASDGSPPSEHGSNPKQVEKRRAKKKKAKKTKRK